jgi:hypothetical protein
MTTYESSMTTLTPGQSVEVNEILCSNAWPEPPSKGWVSGYVVQGFRGNLVVVKQVKPGLFEGCTLNYDLKDVREIKAPQT